MELRIFRKACSHEWKYIDPEHRICSKCGQCQHFVLPPPYLLRDDEGGDHYVQRPKFWEVCRPDILQKEAEQRRLEILEQEAMQKEEQKAMREAALRHEKEKMEDRNKTFAILESYGLNEKVSFCRKCGAKNFLKDKNCTKCGEPIR